jgi:hypothetical protein
LKNSEKSTEIAIYLIALRIKKSTGKCKHAAGAFSEVEKLPLIFISNGINDRKKYKKYTTTQNQPGNK